jgi:mycothiol synthase
VINVRPVETDADIDTYLDVRNRVHPRTPMPREAVLDQREKPGNLDLIAELDGRPVGAATVAAYGGAPDGKLAYLTLHVIPEARRQGVGSALHRRTSEHAGLIGKERFFTVVRADDPPSLGYYATRGFEERGRTQDVVLDLAAVRREQAATAEIEIVPLGDEHEQGVWEVACEADADVPSAEPIVTGSIDDWRKRHRGPLAIPELSLVALEQGRVIGYAILGRHDDATADHWMTGVARSARGRGVARALKQAQISGAAAAGWRFLRTQNDLGNAPMRRVNEQLGYVKQLEWVQLVGPLFVDG